MTTPHPEHKLPEPVAWITSHKAVLVPFTQAKQIADQWKQYGWPVVDLYDTTAQLEQVRRETIEQCAKVCDEIAAKWGTFHQVAPEAAHDCARTVRALASNDGK